jgi:hypothetical protein
VKSWRRNIPIWYYCWQARHLGSYLDTIYLHSSRVTFSMLIVTRSNLYVGNHGRDSFLSTLPVLTNSWHFGLVISPHTSCFLSWLLFEPALLHSLPYLH